MAARSFNLPITSIDGLVRPLAAVRSDVPAPSGGLVFISGAPSQELGPIADQVRTAWKGVATCIVPAAGVLTERGEVEGAPAMGGILWSGGKVVPLVVNDGAPATALRDAIVEATAGRSATVILFPRSDFSPDMLEGLGAAAPAVRVFGAGTVGGPALTITATGEVKRGRAVGLVLLGSAPPLVESTAACRLLSPLRRIDETSGGMVLSIDGTPALDLLSSSAPGLRDAGAGGPPPVVFAALADAAGEGSDDRYVIRPVRGIDPGRRGILVGSDARVGQRIAFAVRDAAAARAGLEASARSLAQQALGAAPRFALYFTCAGRGQGLYGAPDVEARILRHRFGDLPIAGMHAAFEITPWSKGESRVALYTGVLALFRSPS
jgi:small ligand-binding sensory domain FIST